ncbi:type II CAAX prenyl endopeptidase Rce1 family protein [Peribacillus simplex]
MCRRAHIFCVGAWAYEKTGSIWPSVMIHGLFNGLAVILTFLE